MKIVKKNLGKDVFARSKIDQKKYEEIMKRLEKRLEKEKRKSQKSERIRLISSKKRKTRGNTCRSRTMEQKSKETSENEQME